MSVPFEDFIIKRGDGVVELGFCIEFDTPYFIRADGVDCEFQTQVYRDDLEKTLDCFSRMDDFDLETIRNDLRIVREGGKFSYYRGEYTTEGFKWVRGSLTEEEVKRFIEVLGLMLEKMRNL